MLLFLGSHCFIICSPFFWLTNVQQLYGSAPHYGVDKELYGQRHPTGLPYTDYLVTGAIIGELNCLTKQEMEYMVTCETAVQVRKFCFLVCFIKWIVHCNLQ